MINLRRIICKINTRNNLVPAILKLSHYDTSKVYNSKSYNTPIKVPDINKKKITSKDLPKWYQRYFFWRYSLYLKKFQQALETEMPDTFRMFRIFGIGFKEFVLDFKDYLKVLVILSMPGQSLKKMNLRQLDLYYHMPKDMFKVFPVLLVSSIPFGQNVAFPIGYLFPRQLLCRHFWSISQKHDFSVLDLKKRLYNARPVFRDMQASLSKIDDKRLKKDARNVFSKLGSGVHPNVKEIIALKPLFSSPPLGVKFILSRHVTHLLRLHGKSIWLRRRKRLFDHAYVVYCMDTALAKEKISNLTPDKLRNCLFLRGVNPTGMSDLAIVEFLEQWLQVSQSLDRSSYSLLLHLPILLAYNMPSNLLLIY